MDRKSKYRKRARHNFKDRLRPVVGGKCGDFQDVKSLIIEVTKDVLENLSSYKQLHNGESAGILLGSQIGQPRFRINRISPPCSDETISSSCSCVRNCELANKFIKKEFESSEHTRVYVGEWHTHPEDVPTPSDVDISSIIEIFESSNLVFDFIILCIVGRKSNYWGIYNGHLFRKFNPIEM